MQSSYSNDRYCAYSFYKIADEDRKNKQNVNKTFVSSFWLTYICRWTKAENLLFSQNNLEHKTYEDIGLSTFRWKKVESVVAALKQLLADYQIFYTNLRGFHWNVKGKGFFTLHAKYEELYNDAAEKIDEIAERILQLGYTPENRFSEYLKTSNIKEDGNLPLKGKDGLRRVLENLGNLIAQERKIVDLAGEYSDEATVALMDDFLVGQEKNVWMLVSFLDKHPEEDQL